ncbi:ketopantoate reductase PanE/ApbA C terminal-domain-containing protein [Aspergillus bertholletiae]|uniref:Ketopantoate reductase PanE/ApbA C terminal-domain-containing protein n=1 Tax=Aspergillus bertholletiae TaxID=1226010 RepID=A0A5N7BJS6_9EURO|nr:ketopantoate reductase PanE/ApbA C terminal-domain-containing protein [Aspergillus bertholletiae]
MIDEVNESLFPNPATRPSYIIGVISHGVTLNRPFNVTHTGFSAISLGLVLHSPEAHHSPESTYLLDTLPLSPRLNATSYSYSEVLQIQLEKLAVNAFCNPVCALNDAKNAFLFTVPDTRREILTEISNVVLALPDLRDAVGVKERFAVDRLEATVNAILTKTAETTCSMVWDLRAGRETEVRFINGYWVKRGREVGVRTPVNEYLVEEVTKRSRR